MQTFYLPNQDLLQDKIILVTGAGSGIGAMAAKTFAQYGATVILLGRTVHKLEVLYDQIEAAGYPQAAIYPMNLEGATAKDYADLALNIENEFGRLDGLLHNAAILGTLTPLPLYDMELWFKVMQVNLHAPYFLTRVCLPLLKKSSSASVVFTSDNVSKQAKAYWGAYSVSKAGVDNMMQIFAEELCENTAIRVNSFNPGKIKTAMRKQAYPGEDNSTLKSPEALAWAYLFLFGKDSQTYTGQYFTEYTLQEMITNP